MSDSTTSSTTNKTQTQGRARAGRGAGRGGGGGRGEATPARGGAGKPRGRPRNKPRPKQATAEKEEEEEEGEGADDEEKPQPPLQQEEDDEEEGKPRVRGESLATCLLCCHVIDNVTRFDTVGVCEHTGCCSRCALRMRQLMGARACVMCKTELPRVICLDHSASSSSSPRSFASFQDWGDNIGPLHVFDEASGMFLLKKDAAAVRRLRDPVCPRCDKKCTTVSALKSHVGDAHQLQYCGICLEHKKAFVGEHALFTKEGLRAHCARGEPREGFLGHPRCDFCFSRHYTNAELFDHLHKTHFECDLCVRARGVKNRYYKDYPDLENHFRADHFLCEEPRCLARKFVVFGSHLDLQAHMTEEHPHIKTSRKIDVHFTVRRATRDGANGTGNGNGNDGFESHQHLLQGQGQGQAHGADHVINVADFPSLSLADGPAASGQVSLWSGGQRLSRPRMEEFPELGGGGSGNGGGNAASAAAFRNALAPPPTPAMLAHMGPQDGWEYSAAAEALGANNPLMRFVKPAKGKMKKRGKTTPVASPTTEAQRQHQQQQEEEEERRALAQEEAEAAAAPEMSKSALVLKIRQELGSDAKYEVFRETCRQFRARELAVAEFYEAIQGLFPRREAFDTLFMRLMRLSPDREQVDEVVRFHRQQRRAATSASASSASPSPQQQQQQQQKKKPQSAFASKRAARPPPPPSASGWANALRASGISTATAPAPIVVPSARGGTWNPALAPAPSAAASSPLHHSRSGSPSPSHSTSTPSSSKITSAPVESFAAMAMSSGSGSGSGASSSYAQSMTRVTPSVPPPQFRNNQSEFPGLPSAGRAVGVQAVTRATWDDQVQAIAQNRVAATGGHGGGGKKKQKKKTMSLGQLAMQFS